MEEQEIRYELEQLDKQCKSLVNMIEANIKSVEKICDRKYQLQQELKS